MKPVLVSLAAVAVLAGCQTVQNMWSGGPKATANLEPTKGSNVRGTVNFVQTGDKVRVTTNITGLRPNGEFGFHIHEAGDCSSGDGMSAKGHFNPYGKPHGQGSERHAGDMPSLKADANGNANASFDLDIITVNPGPASIVGRGLIVHVQPDDYRTQPTGNAGARSACAVIQRS